jgi:hypothetical protein
MAGRNLDGADASRRVSDLLGGRLIGALGGFPGLSQPILVLFL